jgi:hypothetical protein
LAVLYWVESAGFLLPVFQDHLDNSLFA